MNTMPSPLRRAALAVVVIVAATMVSTCGFLTSDIFPRWLSYAEASVDFRSIAVAQGLGADAHIENLELAPYVTGGTDYSKVLVFATGNYTSRLMLLDPDRLSFSFATLYGGFTRALASVTGGFLCGTQRVDPLNPASIPTLAHAWTNNTTSVRVFRVGDPSTGSNYSVDPLATQALFESYPTAWGVATSTLTKNYDTALYSYNLLDADYANGYSVLGQRQDNGQGYAACFPDSATFTVGVTVFDSATALKTGPFPVADSNAWLTADGPVAFYRGDNGSNRLVRYKWGTGNYTTGAQAEELDSLVFDDNDVQLLSFDPSGTWWFIYDKLSGRLYKLRTWWK
ncbi:MAG TPA: hypothetical protein VMX33_03920 [bacterium]|nr:hypothetical protein [bacterium]